VPCDAADGWPRGGGAEVVLCARDPRGACRAGIDRREEVLGTSREPGSAPDCDAAAASGCRVYLDLDVPARGRVVPRRTWCRWSTCCSREHRRGSLGGREAFARSSQTVGAICERMLRVG